MDLRIANVSHMNSNTLYIKHKQVDSFPTDEEIVELVDVLLEKAEKKPFYVISDFTDMFQNWSDESKNYLANHEELNNLKLAQAIVVNTLPIKLLVKLYFSFYKPPGVVKVFDDLEKAKKWLKTLEKVNL